MSSFKHRISLLLTFPFDKSRVWSTIIICLLTAFVIERPGRSHRTITGTISGKVDRPNRSGRARCRHNADE
jgi:hypothetical protein